MGQPSTVEAGIFAAYQHDGIPLLAVPIVVASLDDNVNNVYKGNVSYRQIK